MGRVVGKVVAVSESGDLVTNIAREQLHGAPRDEHATICCDGHETRGLFEVNHSEPELTLIAILNDANVVQLSLVGESAQAFFGIQTGQEVVVRW